MAKDYDLRVQYNGSDNYVASSGNGNLRVKGGIGWNFVIGQDWTHIGNSTYVNGSIFDEIYQTPILGDNISQYTISLSTGEGDLIDIAFYIEVNKWKKTKSYQLNIIDIKTYKDIIDLKINSRIYKCQLTANNNILI